MENYEVNILKRNGDWKKINPKSVTNYSKSKVLNEASISSLNSNFDKHPDFLSSISEVKLIVEKLENLENEKNTLKVELKKYENFFLKKKFSSEKKLSDVSKELDMFNKAIEIIKNLKQF